MSRPDEGLIHQWLDGECTPEESARLEQLVATDPEWAAAVAEARGLIAASARIVQSLDAVPRAMPKGSVAAPRPVLRARSTVQPWMRIAAAAVLVAGTAFVLRESTTKPFTPSATIDMPAAAQPGPTIASADRKEREAQPEGVSMSTPTSVATGASAPAPANVPTSVPAMGPAGMADRVLGEQERGATQGAPAPVLLPEVDARKTSPPLPPAPAAAPPPSAEEVRTRVANVETQRRSRLAAEAPRGAAGRTADAAAATSTRADAVMVLAGCWRVSAPPELLGVLRAPEIRRQRGDTLVLVTMKGDVVVLRNGDVLTGGLEARAEVCRE